MHTKLTSRDWKRCQVASAGVSNGDGALHELHGEAPFRPLDVRQRGFYRVPSAVKVSRRQRRDKERLEKSSGAESLSFMPRFHK